MSFKRCIVAPKVLGDIKLYIKWNKDGGSGGVICSALALLHPIMENSTVEDFSLLFDVRHDRLEIFSSSVGRWLVERMLNS